MVLACDTVHVLEAAQSPSPAPWASSHLPLLCVPMQSAEPHSSAKKTAHASPCPECVTGSPTASMGVTRNSAGKVGWRG